MRTLEVVHEKGKDIGIPIYGRSSEGRSKKYAVQGKVYANEMFLGHYVGMLEALMID